MSDVHKEQLVMAFKPNVLSEVSQAEVALLASWIEDILTNLDVKDDYLPGGRLMN
jgi:hypothetical protein